MLDDEPPSRPSAGLATGTIVHRYRIEELLGRGGMGAVYRAVDVKTGSPIAVKALHPHMAKKDEFQRRFLREARAAMAAPHPNIVTIHEVFEHDGSPMLAMELLEGESLERVLRREKKLPLDRVARILVHVTSALGTAHALGIVHRDLKPDNIFIGKDTRIKVLDFGIAKLTATEGAAAETAALTQTGALMGTPFYMSPEQAFGEKKIDQRADIWSLGIILYRCLSGILPTRGGSFGDVFRLVVSQEIPPIQTHVPTLPADVAALVSKMLSKTPGDRPWDLREVHTVLERYARVAIPVFGQAVLPMWDEASSEERAAAEAPPNAAVVPTGTLAMTPGSLKLARGPALPQKPAQAQGPSATIAMTLGMEGVATPRNYPVPVRASSPSVPPPKSSRDTAWWVLGILVFAAAGALAVYVFLR